MRGARWRCAENISTSWLPGDSHTICLAERPMHTVGAGSGTPLHACRYRYVYLLNHSSCQHERDRVFPTAMGHCVCPVCMV